MDHTDQDKVEDELQNECRQNSSIGSKESVTVLLENDGTDSPVEKAFSDHEELPSGENPENLPESDDEDEVKSECGQDMSSQVFSLESSENLPETQCIMEDIATDHKPESPADEVKAQCGSENEQIYLNDKNVSSDAKESLSQKFQIKEETGNNEEFLIPAKIEFENKAGDELMDCEKDHASFDSEQDNSAKINDLSEGQREFKENYQIKKENVDADEVKLLSSKKRFSCSLCGKTFPTQNILKAHERIIHAGDDPFGCSHCELKCST